ncbi:MAG: hypothetical protein KDB14_03920 [Planctomycetales bacterium]|nr:hypothetical protein [Planctomycetales bacterium]
MAISQYLKTFAGRPVARYEISKRYSTLANKAWRVAAEYHYGELETPFIESLTPLIAAPKVSEVSTLVVGPWDGIVYDSASSAETIELLVAAAPKLASVKAMFFGDIVYRDTEISWIQHRDISPLLSAYQLEEFALRGVGGLQIGQLKLPHMKRLTFQAGGLPSEIIRQIVACEMPNLESLDLWLGVEQYWGNATADDLAPILDGCFPKVKRLALCNKEKLYELLPAILTAPILKKLQRLDLSMSTLIDEEAELLLSHAKPLKKLKELDLSQNFLSADMVEQLKNAGLPLIANDQRQVEVYDDEVYRYAVTGE